ncbi:uncharacterized protein LOC111055519 isoform X1 [Nilaparvata lugens]|uniref:uncharacterized protein LOC111055519 isoform X1 n=1 Tax=Nilaparvata lugens TaxID=108931 RepID=UPI00193E3227|nr:uncharacterized protein LOC111055519 isoform X1 [Nilaparvata lugens]
MGNLLQIFDSDRSTRNDSRQGNVDLTKSPSSRDQVQHDAALEVTEAFNLESMDFVAIFPLELTYLILSYLSSDDLKYCDRVSQLWSRTIHNFIQSRDLIERVRLKHNWQQGKYSVHWLHIPMQKLLVSCWRTTLIPSNDNVFYYPLVGRLDYEQNLCGLYLFRLDAALRMATKLVFMTSTPYLIWKVCVLRDCLVWIYGNQLMYYDGETHRTIEHELHDNSDGDLFIRMDSHHIVAWTEWGYLKVWCKRTTDLLELERNEAGLYYHLCSFHDGCLVIFTCGDLDNIHYGKISNISKLEIHNLRNDKPDRLQYRIYVDGKADYLASNERYIILIIICPITSYRLIQVRDIENRAVIKYTYPYFIRFELYNICDDYIILREDCSEFVILTLATGEQTRIVSTSTILKTLFENIAVNLKADKTLQVLDWRDQIELHRLPSPKGKADWVVDANEYMVVTYDKDANTFVVFKYG